MNALSIIRIAVIWIGVVWIGLRLLSNPGNRVLRPVFAAFAILAITTTDGTLFAGIPPALDAGLQYVLEIVVSYFVLAAFASVARTNLRRYLIGHAILLGIAVTATMLCALAVPAQVRLGDFTEPSAARMYLVAESYITIVLFCAVAESRRAARGMARVQAIALIITAAGLALLGLATATLCVVHIMTISGYGYHAQLGHIGGMGILVGGPIFIIGLCYTAIVMRIRASWYWIRHLRAYIQLRPLWQVLHDAFPRTHLQRGATTGLWGALSPRGADRKFYRRFIESLDALVRISPYLPASAATGDYDQRARDLIAAADNVARTPPAEDHGPPGPLAIPVGTTMDDDTNELVRLSIAIKRQRRNTPHHEDGERWSPSSEQVSQA